ncbi:universal stress protein [Streptosporangium sp. NPDC048047]|uniref:universal stress protein n=1 Tax=Streptosporangium sp. NPDC048047 TaxID=3155748 RepID=UPI0034291C25
MILVGVDGSHAGLGAVSWAVREARLRRTALRVVHVMPAWPLRMTEGAPYAEVGRWMRDGAAATLTGALARVEEEGGGVETETELLPGEPRNVLLEAAREAELLVVGSHGLGGFRGMLLGSIALGVTGRASCPVAVVRDLPAHSRGEVVVGVDGSPGGAAAVDLAFAEAALRGAPLRAVHVWRRPVAPFPARETAEDERRVLAEALAGRGEGHPDVKVVEQVEQGHPVEVLRDLSARADLLVVGSRGRGELGGLLLGSVSHSLIHHAACPMIVVPGPPEH